jgi:TPR repeat protein
VAVKGDVEVQVFLAGLYWHGTDVPRDLSAARSWAERAAAQGSPMGEALLAAIAFEQERNA